MKSLIAALFLIAINVLASANASQRLEIDNLNINYIDKGKGDAIVLIHGLGADLSRFEHNIDFLAQHYRVIAIDLPGFGESDRGELNYSGEYFVEFIEKIRTRLSLGKVTLIGNSMGGWLSLLYANFYPEHTRSLVLIAPAFYLGLPDNLTASMLATGANPSTVEQMRVYVDKVLFQGNYTQEEIVKIFNQHQHFNRGDAINKIAQSLYEKEHILDAESIGKINAPTLIIQGDKDGIVFVKPSQHLYKMLPHSRIKVLKDVGHWPQWERPDLVNPMLKQFLIEQ